MKNLFQTIIVSAVLTAAMTMVACSHKEEAPRTASAPVVQTPPVTKAKKSVQYSVVSFKPGSAELTENAKRELRTYLGNDALKSRNISQVQILSWADREYPAAKTEASSQEKKIADLRATAVASYVKSIVSQGTDIEKHNMAVRPGYFAELMNTEDYEIKNSMEAGGSMPTSFGSAKTLSAESKASKAMIWVEFE